MEPVPLVHWFHWFPPLKGEPLSGTSEAPKPMTKRKITMKNIVHIIDDDRICPVCGKADGRILWATGNEGCGILLSIHAACFANAAGKGRKLERSIRSRARQVWQAEHNSGAIDRARRQHGIATPQPVN